MTPEYAVQAYKALHDWLHRLYSLGQGHGARLATDLASEVSNNCRTSDELLELFTNEGWIVRDPKPKPTRDQVFFGWGGKPPGRRGGYSYPSEYGYRPADDLLERLKNVPLAS